jgi:hypothetical protein
VFDAKGLPYAIHTGEHLAHRFTGIKLFRRIEANILVPQSTCMSSPR